MLQINKETNGTSLVIALEGTLDTATAPSFETELKTSLDGVTELIIELEKLTYISSAGLRVLLYAQKEMDKKGAMVVKNATDEVQEIFNLTGFSKLLTIE